jgi:hypothetical protein
MSNLMTTTTHFQYIEGPSMRGGGSRGIAVQMRIIYGKEHFSFLFAEGGSIE